jgi:WD40 repeat protein
MQGAAYLWRIENMDKPIAILRHGRDKTVWSACFSSDGTRILTASDDSTAKLWNGTGDLLRIFRYRSELNGAVFSPDDSRILAIASSNNTALVWEIATPANTSPKELKHTGMVRFARFSADGTRILTTSHDKTAVLWSAVSLARIATFRHENPVSGGEIAPDASHIITFTDNGAAFLWSSSGVKIKALLHDKRVLHAEFSHDGNKAITTSADFSAKLWDVKTTISQPISTFRHGNAVLYAAFSPDDSRVVTTSSDKTAKAWDIKAPDVPFAIFYHSDIVQMASFTSNGERVLTCSDDHFAKLWDLYHSSPIRLFWSAHGGSLFSPPESPIIPSPSYIIDWLDDATIAPLQNDLRLKYGMK